MIEWNRQVCTRREWKLRFKKNHTRKKWEDSWIYRHKGEGVPRGHEGKIN